VIATVDRGSGGSDGGRGIGASIASQPANAADGSPAGSPEDEDVVILRVVGGVVPPGQIDAVVEAYRRDYVPIAEQAVGLDRFMVGARPDAGGDHPFAAMTVWTSVEAALAAYGGDLEAVRTLDGRGHGEHLTRVDYYEVDEAAALRRPGAPAHLRLTAGTVARGLDADIQQELRRRLPDLPAEVIEAFVGRRVLGSEVEIALVTVWSGVPEGTALDAPIWPAISSRYDAFAIQVLDVVLAGAGPG
jgi:hypothetical protein